MQLYFGDERNVAPDHADSNFRMATEALVSKAPLKPDQVIRIKGEYKDTERAAEEYEQALRASFKLAEGQFPRFDLVLLGMGNEGHTLSLFPGTKALHERKRLAVRNWIGKLYTERITLTAPVVYRRGQGAGAERRARRALRTGTAAVADDRPEQRETTLAGRHRGGRHARNRSSRIIEEKENGNHYQRRHRKN
jgi:hypothetical protein